MFCKDDATSQGMDVHAGPRGEETIYGDTVPFTFSPTKNVGTLQGVP